jgi:hypothetical protein
MALAQHINNVLSSITNQDGDKFASLISLKNTIAGNGNHQLENAAERVCTPFIHFTLCNMLLELG